MDTTKRYEICPNSVGIAANRQNPYILDGGWHPGLQYNRFGDLRIEKWLQKHCRIIADLEDQFIEKRIVLTTSRGIIIARLGKIEGPIVRSSDESHLIRLAKRGDRGAMSELYNRHVARILQYVRYRVGDQTAAEDITADVFLRALESLGNYDDQGTPFVAWLYRIAYARVVDYWRSNHRRQTAPLDDPLLQDGLITDDDYVNVDVLEHRSLLLALHSLTDDQQSVIIMKFVQGLDNAEIALILGKTEGAVKALQRRGLEALARVMKE